MNNISMKYNSPTFPCSSRLKHSTRKTATTANGVFSIRPNKQNISLMSLANFKDIDSKIKK